MEETGEVEMKDVEAVKSTSNGTEAHVTDREEVKMELDEVK